MAAKIEVKLETSGMPIFFVVVEDPVHIPRRTPKDQPRPTPHLLNTWSSQVEPQKTSPTYLTLGFITRGCLNNNLTPLDDLRGIYPPYYESYRPRALSL